MAGDVRALSFALLLCILWLIGRWARRCHAQLDRASAPAIHHRLLKPRPPDDCPVCRRQHARPAAASAAPPPVRPWRELKSRRGAPKRIPTGGFACPNHACRYHGITDAQVHALVGDSTHGQRERIQTFRCQACGTTFSAHRHTPLYRLKTASTRVAEVLSAVAEGLPVAAAVRVFGHSEGTITTWLTRAVEHSVRRTAESDDPARRSGLGATDLGDRAGSAIPRGPAGMVAWVLPLCAAPCILTHTAR
jgi:hypothetical protein